MPPPRADRPEAARAVVTRAPTRIDFGGGWTDVPPYTVERGGCVCNVAIARYATARLTRARSAPRPGDAPGASVPSPAPPRAPRRRGGETALAAAAVRRAGLRGLALEIRSDFPFSAGLGGSSAAGVAAVAALAAWRHEHQPPEWLAEQSRLVEVQDLGVAGGRQDHYAAAFGGALGLWFTDHVTVRRIGLSEAERRELERRCIVLYTGQSRISGDTITAVLDAYRDRVPRVVGALERMKALAEQMIGALERGALDELGRLVGEHWTHQRALHPGITTARIDEIVRRAHAAGALGAKALGASGGGCVAVIAAGDGEGAVRRALHGLGDPLDFAIDVEGCRVLAA